jgi:enoyl-CoA hydratase
LRSDFDFIMQFWDCPKPTIAAVHGHCVAGGLELAVACDITIADSTAVFGEPEVRFGSSIVSLILPWVIGPKAAKDILLTGRDDITAERAYQLGIVNHLVEPGEHRTKAIEVAKSIATASTLSVQMTKRAINRGLDSQGMRNALLASVDSAILIEASMGPEREEFNRIRSTDGLKAAIAWRNARNN